MINARINANFAGMKYNVVLFFLLAGGKLFAQQQDTVFKDGAKVITLSPVVIDNKLNVPAFITRIKSDTSFYKAFRNLHILNFKAINDIRMTDADGKLKASLYSHTSQSVQNNCRSMTTTDQQASGDFFNDDSSFNYYTASMYASLFFTKGIVCGEDNIVGARAFSTEGKSGMEKHKEQLKMLFFNPGRRINGIPFMGNKTAIYDDDMADSYDMEIDYETHANTECYVFKQKVKPGREGSVVVDEMTTWFNEKTFEVVARNYSLSYNAPAYDFKVKMEVEMTTAGNLTVPSVIRYNGNWKAIFKKRERGIFTATLSDFK